MANVAFDCPNIQRVLGRPKLRKGVADGAGFDGITNRRASAMSFEIPREATVKAQSLIRLFDEVGLGLPRGLGNTRGPAILVGACVPDDRTDSITVTDSVRETLENSNAKSFTPGVTVGAVVEAVTLPVRA